MAARKQTRKKTPAAPARRRRRTATPAPARRRSRTRGSSGKFDIVQNIAMPAAGAAVAILAGNAISRMVPQIPMGKVIIPLGLAFATGTILKQPAIAAGMAAAGGIALLNQVSPTMFADESLDFIAESPIPEMIDFSEDSEDAFLELNTFEDENSAGVIKYDAMNNPVIVYPDGTIEYAQ